MAVVRDTSTPQFLKEDDGLNQECKELLPSLPKDKVGGVFDHIYNYQGFWYYPKLIQGLLGYQRQFEAQDDDILLVTPPKSGTTWLKAIVFTLINRGQYVVSDPQHPLFSKNPHDLVPPIDLMYFQSSNPDLSSFTSPRLFSTHLPFLALPHSVQSSSCKLVYLCRNPKDTFLSSWHYTNELKRLKNMDAGSFEDDFNLFCRGMTPYGPFWDHILGYWQKSLEIPNRVLFLTYEGLKQQPVMHLKKLAQFLDCPFSADEETSGLPEKIEKFCSFDNLSNLDVNRSGKSFLDLENKSYFRRGKVGDWKNSLTAEMTERMDCLIKQKFHALGLEFWALKQEV